MATIPGYTMADAVMVAITDKMGWTAATGKTRQQFMRWTHRQQAADVFRAIKEEAAQRTAVAAARAEVAIEFPDEP